MIHPAIHDLTTLAHELLAEAVSASSGRASRTVFGEAGQAMHQTLVALVAGQGLAEHGNPGQATVQVLLGAATVNGGPEPLYGTAGTLLAIPDGPHSLAADQDTVLLLTIARRMAA
jgi:quercetin dioxygenase-like cupin family protein